MIVDSHCHLNSLNLTKYDGQLESAIQAARDNDVGHILCAGVTLEEFPTVFEIAQAYDDVSCSVGLHPSEKGHREPSIEELVLLSQHEKVVAFGETGLDYYYGNVDIEWQKAVFRNHIRAAKIVKKPLIIHSRQASPDLLSILKEEGADEVGGVFHCFTDTLSVAQAAMEMNFYIGISGIVTFEKALELKAIAKALPLDRILLETDAPYLAPVPLRGQPNEPANVRYVAEYLAVLRQMTYADLASATTENYYRLFGEPRKNTVR